MTPREELEKQAREQQRLERERVDAFQAMVKTDGWRHFCDLLNGRVGELTKDIFGRPEVGANARGEDYDKGACYHLLWARDLPETIIQSYKDQPSDPASEENEQ